MPEPSRVIRLERRPDAPVLVPPAPTEVGGAEGWTSSGKQPWRKVRCACGGVSGEVYGRFDPAVVGARVRCRKCGEMVRLA